MTKPTIGRIVHFYDTELTVHGRNGAGPYPAIILDVHEDNKIDVMPFQRGIPSNYESTSRVPEGKSSETVMSWWNWPPREQSHS